MKFWFTNHHTATMWAFFVLNNLLEFLLLMALQTMRCTICHIIEQVQSSNNTTCEHKGLLTYNPMHSITSMKKHIDNEHKAIVAKYVLHCKSEDEAFGSSHAKSNKNKQATPSTITDFFLTFNFTKILIPFS
jgi:hypothetical protein